VPPPAPVESHKSPQLVESELASPADDDAPLATPAPMVRVVRKHGDDPLVERPVLFTVKSSPEARTVAASDAEEVRTHHHSFSAMPKLQATSRDRRE
jgi:hypothetical protein